MYSKTFDMAAHEAKLDRLVSRAFSASFMSNTKWRRAFLELSARELEIDQLIWKFVGREVPARAAVPDADCLGDRYIRDVGFAVFPYKEIEWIEVPRISIPNGYEAVPFKHRAQDLGRAQEALGAIGQFEMSLLSEGLRVYGYRRDA